ncbi:Por secretion system C-terminal sorting domain-containing protein [Dyadobacter soli]|uniref:Por secretion system C-terminal sorting domain-containing protein n=2 Tax=Dyadobacter soli TaxID=659014 RepID=A0A1G7NBL6_9BACT|nr:Por secretion system C-terminal sorting domain-containing protein [Dyadobacter soli]
MLLVAFTAQSQDVVLDWAKAFQSTAPGANSNGAIRSLGYGVATDGAGNVYISGYWDGTIDLDPGAGTSIQQSLNGNGAFIVKLSPSGNLIWQKTFSPGITSYGLHADGAGNVYSVGYFFNTVDFNPSPTVTANLTSAGGGDPYILKLNANGDYVWAQRMGGTGTEYSHDVDVDASGNVYVAGYLSSPSSSFPGLPNVASAGGTDGFVAKLNSAGTFQWVKTLGGPNNDNINGIDVDASGNVYASGNVGGAATGMGNIPDAGAAVVKLNGVNGNTVWATGTPGSSRGVEADPSGNVYITGNLNTSGNLVKLNSAGAVQWTKAIGSGTAKLSLGPDNNVYVTGTYLQATSQIGSFTLPSSSNQSTFASKIDASGEVLWAKGFTGSGAATPLFVNTDASGAVYVSGAFAQTVDFDPSDCVANLTNTTAQNTAFVVKLRPGGLPAGFAVSATSLSPLSQSACSLGVPNLVNGNAVGVTFPSGFSTTLSYQWQKATSTSGPWEDMPGEVFKDMQPLASSETLYYRRIVKAALNTCGDTQGVDTSAVATVNVGTAVAPTANADGPQWYVCGPGNNTVSLAGSATGGAGGFSYAWYAGNTSGTPVSTAANYTTGAVTQATTYTLKVTDGAGCVDTDQVTVVPAVANAGADASFCQGAAGVQIGTAPVASPSVKYAWTLSSGATATTLSCTNCAQPIANPTAATTYRLTVTTTKKDGTTCSTFDNVVVAPVTAPGGVLAFAGPDQTICTNSTVQLGVATDASYTYTWGNGAYLSATNIARPTFTAGSSGLPNCAENYILTAVKNGCAFEDEVKVSVINAQTSDSGDTECGPRWVYHEGFPNCPQAVYTWTVVSGDGDILQTRNNGEEAYLRTNGAIGDSAIFRRTVTLNGVSCSTDMTIKVCDGGCDVEIKTISSQGCPKVFPGEELRLAPIYPVSDDWNYRWSPANLVDNPSAREVRVLSSSPATITLTIVNKYDASITCSDSIEINPAGATQPVVTLTDKAICYDSPTQIGSLVSGGLKYKWLPAIGLDNDSIANPTAKLTADQQYIVRIEDSTFGCVTTDTVNVTVAQVIANAGIDRTICNGATVTLGSPAPEGTNWTYSWEPSGAAWTNGTNGTMPQPQVEFSATGSQTFILTVSDPASGCVDVDSVTLKNELTPGEYTGSGVTICEGEEIQLGKEPIPGAIYSWTGAGLSCTNCSNPIATPTASTTYTLQVSYPGCSAPMIDQVTVTVNPIGNLALIDKTVCPAGPIAIGYGSTGNPAAPAGATYAWSPSAGLSSATVANPTATVTTETTYSVTVTLPGGCTFTDEVKVSPSANAGSDAVICAGESTVIGTPAIAGATYAWTGAGIVGAANIAQPSVRPTTTTTYTVSVTLNGCTTTDQVVVTVNTPANFNITGNTAICVGGNTTLSLVGAPAANTRWQWSPTTGVTSPNATSTTIVANSTQTYRLTQTNLQTGCSNFKEVVVVVSPNTIAATTTPLAVCEGTSTPLPLSVTSTGNYQYVWSPATGLSNAFVASPTVTASTNRTYNVVITDTQSGCQLALSVPVTVKPALECLPPVALSGNVYHDANALVDVTVNSTATAAIPALYVSLIDSTGAILNTIPVNSNGSYDFGLVNPATYSIVLHQNPAGSTTSGLPSGWMNTGENLGTGPGSDAAVNGILTGVIVRNQNVTNANFGIQQPPLAEPKIYVIDQPAVDQEITLNGTHVSTGPGTSSPAQMTGSDPEDGVLNGDGKNRTVVITTLADHGELWYNGVLVKTGQVIPNYDPALMTIKLTGTNYTSIIYQYAYVDQAGVQSPPTTYQISWGKPLPVTLISFDAKAVEQTAVLTWATTEETNSDRFEIQRSFNGKKWETIGSVDAQGESAATVQYSFKDTKPANGDNYYRLKMIDHDLTFTYSGIRSATFDGKLSLVVYPNPAHEAISVNTDHGLVKLVSIFDKNGVKVHSGNQARSINVKGLQSGAYVLTVTFTDGSSKSQNLVIVK